jgi:hypothetical protein
MRLGQRLASLPTSGDETSSCIPLQPESRFRFPLSIRAVAIAVGVTSARERSSAWGGFGMGSNLGYTSNAPKSPRVTGSSPAPPPPFAASTLRIYRLATAWPNSRKVLLTTDRERRGGEVPCSAGRTGRMADLDGRGLPREPRSLRHRRGSGWAPGGSRRRIDPKHRSSNLQCR